MCIFIFFYIFSNVKNASKHVSTSFYVNNLHDNFTDEEKKYNRKFI